MNGYERIRAALKDEKPDKVPIMLHNFLHAAEEAGYSQEEYRNSSDNIASAFIQAVEMYGYDGIFVDLDTVTLAGAVGVPVDFPINEPARSNRPSLQSLTDVEKLKPVSLENYKYISILLEAVRKLSDYFKNDIFIRGNCDQAPFSLASMMRSPEVWMLDLCDEKNLYLVQLLLNYCTETVCKLIRLMAETGAHMVSNGDSPAGPSMISPPMYKNFAFPYERSVVECAHTDKLQYTLHICGDTTKILDGMIETGADALELDYKTDISIAYSKMKECTTFIGNIDPSAVLAMGTETEVMNKTEEIIQFFSDTNRFILNAGCAIPPNTPAKNLHAMIRVARTY
jgi:uroporphyrinogen decarboxylase